MEMAARARRPLLLTGFGPFLDHAENPTALALPGAAVLLSERGVAVHAEVLPVSAARAAATVLGLIASLRPGAVLMTGLAAGADAFRIEALARNLADFASPDVDGARPSRSPVDPSGPETLATLADVPAGVRLLVEAGLPAVASYSAGTYVCNHLYYSVCLGLAGERPAVPALFLHVPPTSRGRGGPPPATLGDCGRAMALLGSWLRGPGGVAATTDGGRAERTRDAPGR